MNNHITLCLRIQFDGPSGQNVSETDVHSLMPWLRNILTNFGLPHPRPMNVMKPPSHYGTSDIDMYWDVVSTNPVIKSVRDRCKLVKTSTLQEKFIARLMVYAYLLVCSCAHAEMATLMFTQSFILPYNARCIPDGFSPIVVKQCSPYGTNFAGTPGTGSSASHSQPNELETRLLKVFESAGIIVPPWPQNLACGAAYIPMLESYIQALRVIAERETARRVDAEANLAEKEAHHARILLDIKEECREPFVVPALLDAFVALSETVDTVVGLRNE